MKSQIYKWLALVAMLVGLVFVVTNATAKKPVKPPPDSDKTKAECIIFTGALETMLDWEVVEGCCPNAGPWPTYAMTLDLPHEDDPEFRYSYTGPGQLFINGYRIGKDSGYKVQFWSWDWDTEIPGRGDVFFELYGGDVVEDKKSKTLTVSFEDELPTLWLYDHWVADEGCCADVASVGYVSFDLLRHSDPDNCP